MNSNNKKSITIDGKFYTISSYLLDDIWKISLTNLNELFVEKLSRQQIIERCEVIMHKQLILSLFLGYIILFSYFYN